MERLNGNGLPSIPLPIQDSFGRKAKYIKSTDLVKFFKQPRSLSLKIDDFPEHDNFPQNGGGKISQSWFLAVYWLPWAKMSVRI